MTENVRRLSDLTARREAIIRNLSKLRLQRDKHVPGSEPVEVLTGIDDLETRLKEIDREIDGILENDMSVGEMGLAQFTALRQLSVDIVRLNRRVGVIEQYTYEIVDRMNPKPLAIIYRTLAVMNAILFYTLAASPHGITEMFGIPGNFIDDTPVFILATLWGIVTTAIIFALAESTQRMTTHKPDPIRLLRSIKPGNGHSHDNGNGHIHGDSNSASL